MTKQSTIASVIGAGLMLATTAFADPYNPADRALGGGLVGAGTGAIIGAIAGGGHGAGIGAAVGGGLGAIAGAASTPPRPYRPYPPSRRPSFVLSRTGIPEPFRGLRRTPGKLAGSAGWIGGNSRFTVPAAPVVSPEG